MAETQPATVRGPEVRIPPDRIPEGPVPAVRGPELRGPLVVCVSADVSVRERVVRQLDDLGPLVLCADLAQLRAMLFTDRTGRPEFRPDLTDRLADPLHAADPVWVPGPPTWSGHPDPADVADPPGPAADRTGPVRLGELSVDPPAHLVTWRGEALALTRLERELVTRLASPPVAVWTYERLFASVWGGAYLGDSAILHSAMKRLRRKLRAVANGPRVHTVRGVGYRLAVEH